jgi:two-component system response regulator AtoC
MSSPTEPPPTQRALQIVVHIGLESRVHPLPTGGKVGIGRGKENSICLADASVSRQHAVLYVRDGSVSIEDLASASGTFLARKGAVIAETGAARAGLQQLAGYKAVELFVGDSLHIGRAILSLQPRSGTVTGPPASWIDAPEARDPKMAKAHELTTRAAGTDLSVLILGETGVGKDILARSLHEQSPRAAGPFTVLNCAALPENLIESVLFGHERGAFTGADAAKAGLLEATAGGTVFLDEIGELAPGTQAKLLRILEDRVVLPVGAVTSRPINVRFVSATHRNLGRRVGEGTFRGDLYHRISGVVVHIPPLRERPLELEPLARLFLKKFCVSLGQPEPVLTPAALAMLQGHRWPGNIRELRNVLERAVIVAEGALLDTVHLHLDPALGELATSEGDAPTRVDQKLPPVDAIVSAERARVIAALQACGGNQTRAAKLLGISRSALLHRLQRFGLRRPMSS